SPTSTAPAPRSPWCSPSSRVSHPSRTCAASSAPDEAWNGDAMGRVLTRTIFGVLWLIWLAPVYLLLVNATRTTDEYTHTSLWSPPHHFALWSNFVTAYHSAGLGGSLYSTALYAVVGPAIAVLVGALAGYAIIALRLRHGFAWFVLVFG